MAAKRSSHVDTKDELILKQIGSAGEVRYGGYKRDLVTQNLSQMEEMIIICPKCAGVMRDACNISGEDSMACKTCVGKDSCTEPVINIRKSVSRLECRCPLNHRGCEWEGEIAAVFDHLDMCEQMVVQCQYANYGCKTDFVREELETHQIEAKDYHRELENFCTIEKIDELEKQSERQRELLSRLQSVVQCLQNERMQYKLNGIIWKITDRETIREKYLGSISPGAQSTGRNRSHPPSLASQTDELETDAARDATTKDSLRHNWDCNNLNGPRFEIENSCFFRPQLSLEDFNSACLKLVPEHSTEIRNLKGSWKVAIKKKDSEDSWERMVDDINFSSVETLKLINIPGDVLTDEEYYHQGAMCVEILFSS